MISHLHLPGSANHSQCPNLLILPETTSLLAKTAMSKRFVPLCGSRMVVRVRPGMSFSVHLQQPRAVHPGCSCQLSADIEDNIFGARTG